MHRGADSECAQYSAQHATGKLAMWNSSAVLLEENFLVSKPLSLLGVTSTCLGGSNSPRKAVMDTDTISDA
jgi:hypothetical protein